MITYINTKRLLKLMKLIGSYLNNSHRVYLGTYHCLAFTINLKAFLTAQMTLSIIWCDDTTNLRGEKKKYIEKAN